jgi:hypothetical protein
MRALAIIHDEHRSLAAVLHGLLYLVRGIRLNGAKPKFDVLGAMVYYIDAFRSASTIPRRTPTCSGCSGCGAPARHL